MFQRKGQTLVVFNDPWQAYDSGNGPMAVDTYALFMKTWLDEGCGDADCCVQMLGTEGGETMWRILHEGHRGPRHGAQVV